MSGSNMGSSGAHGSRPSLQAQVPFAPGGAPVHPVAGGVPARMGDAQHVDAGRLKQPAEGKAPEPKLNDGKAPGLSQAQLEQVKKYRVDQAMSDLHPDVAPPDLGTLDPAAQDWIRNDDEAARLAISKKNNEAQNKMLEGFARKAQDGLVKKNSGIGGFMRSVFGKR